MSEFKITSGRIKTVVQKFLPRQVLVFLCDPRSLNQLEHIFMFDLIGVTIAICFTMMFTMKASIFSVTKDKFLL